MDGNFLKPTKLFKEYMILNFVEKDKNVTQREMSKAIGVAVSMINAYLDEYEEKGYLTRVKINTKIVEYYITKKGSERRKVLNIGFLNSAQRIYSTAKDNIQNFLTQIIDKGFTSILLYGAGEVAEMFLHVIRSDNSIPVKILAMIDDSPQKRKKMILNTKVISRDDIGKYNADGILISSYTHHEAIRANLFEINYPSNKILEFFE
ncbi:MAG: winged helix-turn-helix transcriptional regulator [Candidatus Izemoplasmatales bacterium]|nr:winged helix-turn-helix transcriptional regulator [Candidatus Izemoplasmatales bacterium]